MLNKDCKVSNVKRKTNNRKSVKNNKSRKTTQRNNKQGNKKNRFFYVMLIVWTIPVFISAYILYLQYNRYVSKTKIKKHVVQNRSKKPAISREQIRKLRRKMDSKVIDTNTVKKKSRIYLVKVNRTIGRVYLKPIEVNEDDSSSIDKTIKSLISYRLSNAMKNKSYYSCIPSKTRLLGYRIKNGTLYLNFNNDFMASSSGTQQIKLKAAQIVYTATQFPEIKRVKFIINNKSLKDWGGEGVFPGSVLSRSDVPKIMKLY